MTFKTIMKNKYFKDRSVRKERKLFKAMCALLCFSSQLYASQLAPVENAVAGKIATGEGFIIKVGVGFFSVIALLSLVALGTFGRNYKAQCCTALGFSIFVAIVIGNWAAVKTFLFSVS